MCGITGILHFGNMDNANEIILDMTNAISHRGPDASGFYNDAMISLGHRRLSIIDLDARADQPLTEPNKRYIISFNGEIYNYKAIRQELSHWSFITESDTEVILAAFSTWGIACVNKFDGIFAFSVWDSLDKTLWLARDRMGVKPMYYFEQNQKVLFASEIRALLNSSVVPSNLSISGLTHYLSFQSASSTFPMIMGIKELNAASYLKVTMDKIEEHVYWKVNRATKNHVFNYENVTKTIFGLLNTSVKKRMVSDVPVSAFLSGGVDSSAIVALMSLHSTKPINTFTLAFQETAYDESAYANIIAKRFTTNHTSIVLHEDQLLEEIVNGLNMMDTPSADGINTFILSSVIKNANIKVALSGIGADELFAGYPGFGYFKKIQQSGQLFNNTGFLRKSFGGLLEFLGGEKYSKLHQILQAGNSSLSTIYPILRQFFPPSRLKKILTDTSSISIVKNSLKSELAQLHYTHYLSNFSLAEYHVYAKHTLLKDVDQMSMANGLEVREPFFDTDLIEYVLSVPDHYKTGKYPKQLLLDAISPLLPDEITSRKKKGFVLPWERWMRHELQSFCEVQILECAERDFVHKDKLLGYWNRFLKNDNSIQWIELWQFVVLNYWMKKNNVEYKA